MDNTKKRLIFHVDLDAFFASVEELSRPDLKKKPMAVGHRSRRGIITTANYEARKYGLYSGMPIFQALQLCPQLILVPNRRKEYSKKSKEVFQILSTYSRTIEQTSIDEGYLDLTSRPEDPLFLAHSIQDEVEEKLGLSLSVGIASNKFYAKLASDWKKPHGIFWLKDEEADHLLQDLPISKIHGIGKKGQEKLKSMAIYSLGDLKSLDLSVLKAIFGKSGTNIYNFIRGRDQRPVTVERDRKSIGVERTLEKDIADSQSIFHYIDLLAEELAQDMRRKGITGRTIQLKVKTNHYQTYTRSYSLDEGVDDQETLARIGRSLYAHMPQGQAFRLLGLTASKLSDGNYEQLDFLDEDH